MRHLAGNSEFVRPAAPPEGPWQKTVNGIAGFLLRLFKAWDSPPLPTVEEFAKQATDDEKATEGLREAWTEVEGRGQGPALIAGFSGTITGLISDQGVSKGWILATLMLTFVVLALTIMGRDVRLAIGPLGMTPKREDIDAALRALRRRDAFTRLASALSFVLLGLSALVVVIALF